MGDRNRLPGIWRIAPIEMAIEAVGVLAEVFCVQLAKSLARGSTVRKGRLPDGLVLDEGNSITHLSLSG
jgi:hypothetical protein